jgi:hypothetical protein
VATFSQYVASLPPWESELLSHVDLEADPYTIGVELSSGFRAVSDGSEWHQIQGSFGWAMSNDLSERCAFGMGPARSRAPHSYRSESYGMLSLPCFLPRLAEFTGHNEEWYGIIATDSQSLIDTVMQRSSPVDSSDERPNLGSRPLQVKTFPLDPLLPEWDVVRGIQVLLTSMPKVILQHVKGHQDRTTPYHRLPLIAQLNVDADDQASRYQREHGTFHPDVLHTEWSGVHLILPSGTVTSHYETTLRFQATALPLKAYMAAKYSWPSQVMETINSTAHGSSLRKHLSRRAHLVKLVHGILPTNAHLHRRYIVRRKCPGCHRSVETW